MLVPQALLSSIPINQFSSNGYSYTALKVWSTIQVHIIPLCTYDAEQVVVTNAG